MARQALGPSALAVVRAVQELERAPLLIGCSGGADSLALVAGAAVALGTDRVRAAVVDHGLQPESDTIANQAVMACQSLGVAAKVLPVTVCASGAGLEAAAREARYAALLGDLAPGEFLAVGHTMDDQAETVLLGLARGSGTRSLAGMAMVAGQIVRPLLGLRSATTRAACTEWGLKPWSDPHNVDPAFTRVRVRRQVLPILTEQLGSGVVPALARTALLAQEDAQALDDWAARVLAESAGKIVVGADEWCPVSCSRLLELPAAIRSRVVRSWLIAGGITEPSFVQMRAVLALVTDWRGQGPVSLSGGEVRRKTDHLVLRLR